jgi:hypothetical protein
MSQAWLGIGMLQDSEAFPDFEQIRCAVSDRNAQFNRNPVLYPTELRGPKSRILHTWRSKADQ